MTERRVRREVREREEEQLEEISLLGGAVCKPVVSNWFWLESHHFRTVFSLWKGVWLASLVVNTIPSLVASF